MFAGVDMQQTSDNEDFCRQIFCVLKRDASVPVDGWVFMQKRVLRKYLGDSGLTEVVRPDGRQYMLKHGKVLVEFEFRRNVEKNMRFDLVTHDPDALFSIIAKQQLRPMMLNVSKQQNGLTLGRWLLRGLSRRKVLLTSTTHAIGPRLLV